MLKATPSPDGDPENSGEHPAQKVFVGLRPVFGLRRLVRPIYKLAVEKLKDFDE